MAAFDSFAMILALPLPGTIRLGALHLPLFGLIATAGLLLALGLGDQMAKLTGIEPVKLWDAGVFAVVCAFVGSRLLLAAENLRIFLRHPLLVLAQPSVSFGGLLLTALATLFWLRHKKMPIRRVLNGWAVPGAVLAAVLQVGHFLEGSDAGTPTSLPWGVRTVGLGTALTHPVQIYSAAAFGPLAFVLYRALVRPAAFLDKTGHIAALGLVGGGSISFLLSFFRQPYDSFGDAWLDPAQYAALFAVIVGTGLWITSLRRPSGTHRSATLLAAEGNTLDAQ